MSYTPAVAGYAIPTAGCICLQPTSIICPIRAGSAVIKPPPTHCSLSQGFGFEQRNLRIDLITVLRKWSNSEMLLKCLQRKKSISWMPTFEIHYLLSCFPPKKCPSSNDTTVVPNEFE